MITKRRCPKGYKQNKQGICDIVCPNGTKKNRQGICKLFRYHHHVLSRNNCPKGTRKNNQGICQPTYISNYYNNWGGHQIQNQKKSLKKKKYGTKTGGSECFSTFFITEKKK